MKSFALLPVLLLSLGVAGAAQAHVGVTPSVAAPGTIVEAAFKVGHGCDKAAVTSLSVLAAGPAKLVHPMDSKGWTTALIKKDGKTVGATWTATTPGAALPEAFLMHVELPTAKGPFYFDATQICGDTQIKWNEQPKGDGAKLEHPAPMIDIGGKAPAAGAEEHHHH
jgi:uncharacterized protein YcnI